MIELVSGQAVLPMAAERARWYATLKRVVDVTGAIALLLCLAPLLALCAILSKLDTPGPVLFKQQRVGAGGRPFTMLKFRSMRVDADPEPHRQYAGEFIRGKAKRYAAGNIQLYKLVADSRVTRVGRWLRMTSLDELPQLWNVLRGDMSLVGPRPPIPYELEHYQPVHFQRLAVRPGVTGLWQVSGRNATTFEQMVQMDLQYIRKRSLLLDIEILLKTIPVVLFSRNAR